MVMYFIVKNLNNINTKQWVLLIQIFQMSNKKLMIIFLVKTSLYMSNKEIMIKNLLKKNQKMKRWKNYIRINLVNEWLNNLKNNSFFSIKNISIKRWI